MKRDTYYRGNGCKWGIWNTVAKEFQFGISEDTPMLAEARLCQKIGDDARKYRFQARQIPRDKPGEVMPTWATAHSFDFGYPISSAANSGTWTYDDTGATAPENRPCPRCGEFRGEDGIDPCLGKLPGVTAACCGHGAEDGYVMFDNGVCIRGKFAVELPEEVQQ